MAIRALLVALPILIAVSGCAEPILNHAPDTGSQREPAETAGLFSEVELGDTDVPIGFSIGTLRECGFTPETSFFRSGPWGTPIVASLVDSTGIALIQQRLRPNSLYEVRWKEVDPVLLDRVRELAVRNPRGTQFAKVPRGLLETEPVAPVPDSDYEVYRAILQADFPIPQLHPQLGRRVESIAFKARVTFDDLVRRVNQDERDVEAGVRLVRGRGAAFLELDPSTVVDFVEHNFDSFSLDAASLGHWAGTPPDVSRSIWCMDWGHVDSRHPEVWGFMDLSRVGFNTDRTQALVHVGFTVGSWSGQGWFYRLALEEGSWRVVKKYGTWIS